LIEERCDLEQEVLAGRQLKLENDSLKKAVSSMQDVASDYRVKIQEISAQLVSNGNESRAKINALKIANKEIQKDVDRLETELEQFKGTEAGIEQALAELHAENTNLQTKLSSALTESSSFQAEIDRLQNSIADLQETIQRVERQRDTAQLDRDGMHLKATTLESKLTAIQTEAEKERQNLQAKIDSMAEEINGYQALVRDIENESSEIESSSAVAVRPGGNGQGDTVVLDLLQKASDVVDYEPLKGLDLAISRTHRERREASSSGQLVTTESVTQISVLRNQNRDLRRQLEEERSIGSSSSLLRDDELQRRFENLCDENIKLIDENAALTKSLERVENSLYARETRALDDQREQEANELEIDRLIDANHCLQTKSDALSRINEGYKASIADLQEEVDALKNQRDNNSNANRCHDQTDGDALEEVALLQTENASLRKTNSVLERALNRLTSRAALHQDKLQELTMAQASLEREKEEFDVVVSKIRPRDDFGTSPDAAEGKNICLVENQTKTVTNEEKRDGSINSGERE
jgi:chromosome segregation ATPase